MLNQATPKIIYLEENTHYSNNNFTILRFLLVLILVSKVSVGFFCFSLSSRLLRFDEIFLNFFPF